MSGVDDDMLMAFVDGELDAESADAVRRAIAGDADVARRAAVFETSRAAVRSAFARVLTEPAPRHLVDMIEGGGPDRKSADADAGPQRRAADGRVVAFSPRARPEIRSFASSPLALPLAACLALAVGLGSGFWLGQAGSDAGAGGGGMFGSGTALTAALSSQPSGGETEVDVDGLASRLSVLGSYSVDGGLCRTFRVANAAEAVRGVACDRGNGFAVDVAIADATGGEAGFSPASDGAAESLDAYLDTLNAQGPLSEAEESERLLARDAGR